MGMKYDAPFVFSEVNADMVYWIVHPDGEKTRVSVNSTTVGRNISTKSVYGDYREDITANYKYPEGILLNSPSTLFAITCLCKYYKLIMDSSSS